MFIYIFELYNCMLWTSEINLYYLLSLILSYHIHIKEGWGNIPPCLTTLVTKNFVEPELPHLVNIS